MDKAITQMNNVGIGFSFSSTRNGKYESINGENTIGWYQGDGMVYIYLSPNDYGKSYWPYANPLRLPGTTITNAPREKKGLSDKNALAKYDFVGGCYNDINMVAVMKFASESTGINFNSSLDLCFAFANSSSITSQLEKTDDKSCKNVFTSLEYIPFFISNSFTLASLFFMEIPL